MKSAKRTTEYLSYLFLCLTIFVAGQSHGNGLTTRATLMVSADTATNRQPNSVSVPVRMEGVGLYAVNAFTFFIDFDASKLSFAGIQAVAVSNIAGNATAGLLSVNWSNPSNPVNLTSNTLVFNILFDRISPGDAILTFLPGSKVNGSQGLIAISYNNGILLQTWQLNLQSNPQQGGVVEGSGNYLPGHTVNLSATPNSGYLFDNWTMNGQPVSVVPNFAYTMPAADVTLVANFSPKSYQLITQSVPAQGGTTTGGGIYQFGQTVNLNAMPSTGYQFLNWTINGQVVANTPGYSFTMPDGDLTAWANFQLIPYELSLQANPAEAGTVTGAGLYHYNQNVTVNAFPETGFHFVNWTHGSTIVSDLPSYSFAMPASNHQLSARFLINTYLITVAANNLNFGEVSGGGSFIHGTEVMVQAVPNEGFRFIAWTENNLVVSYDAVYSFIAENDRSLTAVFQEEAICPVPLNLSISNLSETTATLHWVAPADNQWFVFWGEASADTLSGEGWLELAQTNEWALSNLSPQTLYVFYVKTLCPENTESSWSPGHFFSTWYVGQPSLQKEDLYLFPNPAKETLNIVMDENLPNALVELIDLQGKILWQQTEYSKRHLTIGLDRLPDGVYLIRIISNNKVSFRKFVHKS